MVKENLIEAAKLGRVATHSPKAEALRAQTQRRHFAELKGWDSSDQPAWLDEKTYRVVRQNRICLKTIDFG